MSDTKLETIRCYLCDVPFSLTDTYLSKRRADGHDFYCPNGHGQRFQDTFAARTEKAEKNAAFWEAEAQRLLAECDSLRARLGEQAKITPAKAKHLWPWSKP